VRYSVHPRSRPLARGMVRGTALSPLLGGRGQSPRRSRFGADQPCSQRSAPPLTKPPRQIPPRPERPTQTVELGGQAAPKRQQTPPGRPAPSNPPTSCHRRSKGPSVATSAYEGVVGGTASSPCRGCKGRAAPFPWFGPDQPCSRIDDPLSSGRHTPLRGARRRPHPQTPPRPPRPPLRTRLAPPTPPPLEAHTHVPRSGVWVRHPSERSYQLQPAPKPRSRAAIVGAVLGAPEV
jgi:hypothetical protein